MSRENVEIVRRVVEAVAEQDASLLVELTDPEVEWHGFFAQLQPGGLYRGHEGIRQYVKDLGETFDVVRLHIEDTFAIGALVLVAGPLRYRGKGSGVEAESLAGYVVKFRRGRVMLMRAFRDPEKALEAVGLRE